LGIRCKIVDRTTMMGGEAREEEMVNFSIDLLEYLCWSYILPMHGDMLNKWIVKEEEGHKILWEESFQDEVSNYSYPSDRHRKIDYYPNIFT
jgi:hypothetical protein